MAETAGSSPVPGQASVRTGLTSRTAEGIISRFHGDGVRYKAKLIGSDHVPDAQGEKMCWDTMMKLKGFEAVTRRQGKHKQRVWLKISSSGIKIVDERTGHVVYEHDKNRISSPTKDGFDPRALAYIYQYKDAYVLFYIKMACLADHVLLDIKEICQKVDQEISNTSTETQNISLVVLNEASAAPPEGAALEDVFSPQPEPSSSSSSSSSGQKNQVSVNNELMEVFSPQLEQPLSPSQMSCISEPGNPFSGKHSFMRTRTCMVQTESPQPTLSTAQILSMFPTQPVGGSPFTPPPYPPTAVPWGQQGLMGNQWAGPWPSMPGVPGVPVVPGGPAWAPPGVTAPPAGGQPQACSVASPQPGFMMDVGSAASLVPNNPLETLPTPTGSAGNLGPPTFNSPSLL